MKFKGYHGITSFIIASIHIKGLLSSVLYIAFLFLTLSMLVVGFQHSRIVLSEIGYQTITIVVSSYGAISQFLITAGISSTNATNGNYYILLNILIVCVYRIGLLFPGTVFLLFTSSTI